jgi:hypothetical protein
LRVDLWIQSKSENDPYFIRWAGAEKGVVHVIINHLHPYYASLPTTEAIEECVRQYIYDAIAEYKVMQLIQVTPDSVRRMKDTLLRAQVARLENLEVEPISKAKAASAAGG